MKKLILLINLMLATPYFIYGENGSIMGKILDETTGESLIGATIQIEGTTTGTITDFDGNYKLGNLEPGTYTVLISFVSFETLQIEGVTVKAGEPTMINASLSEALTELAEVKVVARSIQKTEAALQVLQRKSANVLDGISSQQISRLGDSDAASALKRVTGVSVQGDKYVYVRGLSDRYMKVTLNNAEIPGLDPNYNTVQMDLFPSNVIETMTVMKSYSPDKPSFTSGLVDIQTKQFPAKFTLSAKAAFEVNTNTHFHDHFLRYEGGKTDWLAFDDGTRSLPDELTGVEIANPTNPENVPLVNEYSSAFSKIWSPYKTTAPLNHSYSLSFGDQADLSDNGAELGYIASISYKTSQSYYDDGRLDEYSAQNANTATADELLSETSGSEKNIWSSLLGLNAKLNANNKIGVNLMHTQNGESTARFLEGHTYYSDDYDMEKYSLEYLGRSLSVAQISGTHVFSEMKQAKIEWMSSYSHSVQNTPDMRFFINEVIERHADDGSIEKTYFVRSNRKPERRYREMYENNWDNKLDITIPFTTSSKIKTGLAYLEKFRNSDENRFTVNQRSAVTDYNGNPSDYLSEANIISGSLVDGDYSMSGVYYANDFFENTRLSYRGRDVISAAYVMADISITDRIRLIGGIRAEYGDIFIENKVDTNDMDLRVSQRRMYLPGDTTNLDYLPSVNLKIEAIDNMNFRMGYSRSVTRPSFRERAPFTFYEYTEGTNIQGNPDLHRGTVDNFDFRWEYFMRPGEMISLSLFYKMIKDPIERFYRQDNTNLTKFRNGEDSYLYGVELEIRKNLGFMGLRNLDFGGNFTYIYSETPVDPERLEQAREIDTLFPAVRPLYGQAPYMINTFIHYENEELGLHANLAFNVEGPKIVIINKRFTPDVYEQPCPMLNFNIGKRLYKKFTLEVAVDNILNPKFKQNITMSNGDTYSFREYSFGRTFSLSVSYDLN
ncbi:MAG: TonB-dependent receptor [Bacteroidales bacterium]|nr:TonB-dependent receptor [Bacteroidales bacterium]